jgi:hypothetical protein
LVRALEPHHYDERLNRLDGVRLAQLRQSRAFVALRRTVWIARAALLPVRITGPTFLRYANVLDIERHISTLPLFVRPIRETGSKSASAACFPLLWRHLVPSHALLGWLQRSLF